MKFLLIFPSLLGKFEILLSEIFYKWFWFCCGLFVLKQFSFQGQIIANNQYQKWTSQTEHYAILHSILNKKYFYSSQPH